MLAAAAMGGDAFRSERLSPQIIGRWAAGLLRGRWRHEEISREEPIAGELLLGMATHYATGIALVEVLVFMAGRLPDRMSCAVGYGVATSVFPLFLMFPSMGFGPAGIHSGEAARMIRVMLVGHVAYGAGIGVGSGLLRTGATE